ncbi:MAG: HAD hydrolase-like protein [Bacilli bacterium]|nr:HAD hydrolase-like protein [Bacilli bacterium]
MVKVKICANKSVNDAKMCIAAKADIIGILVGQEHSSTDFVSKEVAKEICDYAKNFIDVALVTHITNADEIISLTNYIGNNIIQLHSDIKESEVLKIHEALPHVKLIRLIHIASGGTVCTDYQNMVYADYYLLDSFNLSTNQVGGTGLTHDWHKSSEIIKTLDKPVFLAGGLNPNNVKKAIKTANPYGVDVNSGCKNEAGVKDANKVKDFVNNAKYPKKLIFDLDNTLLFLSPEWKACYDRFITNNNYPITSEALFKTIGTIEKHHPDEVMTVDYLINEIYARANIKISREAYKELENDYIHVPLLHVPEVKNLLTYLSSKYEIIAYTNWFTNDQLDRLRLNGLLEYFSHVYGWDILPAKPSKRGILSIVKEDNITDYTFIGDAIDYDLALPKQLGMNVIFYNRKNINQNIYKEVRNITDLKNIL